MIKLILLLTVVVALSACAGMHWDRPSARYRECLKENQADPSVCDKYKEQYEEKIDSKRGAPDVQHGDGEMYEK